MTRPVPRRDITVCPSGFTVDMYCDHETPGREWEDHSGSFYGASARDAFREARAAGWKYHRETRTATCPSCVRALKGT